MGETGNCQCHPVDAAAARGISVVVVTYNSASVLPSLLDSLPEGMSGMARYEIVVVDNASADDSVQVASEHHTRPRIIQTGRNAGYAAAINMAAATVDSDDDILILNPDIRLLPGAVRVLAARLQDNSVGVAAAQILSEAGAVAHSVRREPSMLTAWSDALLGTRLAARIGTGEIVDRSDVYEHGGGIDWATGAILAVSARARRVVGAWDDSFFLYSEEVDYMDRVRRAGLSVEYVPGAKAVHIGGDYHDNGFLAALMTSNRIRYYRRRHGPLASMAFRLSIIVGEAMRFALGPGHRAALRAALSRLTAHRASA